jgi:hypothetical protein
MDANQKSPPFKQVYLYDEETGEFTVTYQAQLSPLDEPGTYIEPVCSTDVAPPEIAADELQVFSNGEWLVRLKAVEAPTQEQPQPPTDAELEVIATTQLANLTDPVVRAILLEKGLIAQADLDLQTEVWLLEKVAELKS